MLILEIAAGVALAKTESNSTDEIDVTPEMIDVGVLAFGEYDCRFEGPEDAVSRIYLAMASQESDSQRRDKLLLRLLKTPPKPRPKRARVETAADGETFEEFVEEAMRRYGPPSPASFRRS
jgi:hypothetical protein